MVVVNIMLIGNKSSFAIEIGGLNSDHPDLRLVDFWAGNTRLCIDDNTAFVPQFLASLEWETQKTFCSPQHDKVLDHKTPVEMAIFIKSTRDEKSANYGLHDDEIYPIYSFLDLGPTTDNLSAFLFRRTNATHLVYSFWRDAKVSGEEVYHTVEVDFDSVIQICRTAVKELKKDMM